ncbi:hypothetical protein MtrunA17_Chr2g0311881 [Medicago truncatula]|uniref:Transmembrane protein n=1 Tax=Medicago truncatula TaxID=3880 RepID=A0A396JDP9_MEDTR|nr:hypothetical protein MtrunA17_Chr2g0311881 [Medicago truncatula]
MCTASHRKFALHLPTLIFFFVTHTQITVPHPSSSSIRTWLFHITKQKGFVPNSDIQIDLYF